MDYKFILLVIMILALIYIITTGFNNLKMQIIHVRDITLDRLRVSSDDLKLRVDGNIGRCIKEVGESNIKFLEQIRKIDNITRQKITNETENYTETESNKKGDEKFSYFMNIFLISNLLYFLLELIKILIIIIYIIKMM